MEKFSVAISSIKALIAEYWLGSLHPAVRIGGGSSHLHWDRSLRGWR